MADLRIARVRGMRDRITTPLHRVPDDDAHYTADAMNAVIDIANRRLELVRPEATDEIARRLDEVLAPILADDDAPCLDDYRRALAHALSTSRKPGGDS